MTQFNNQINKQMIQDLKGYSLFTSFYKYEYKNNKSEKKIIDNHFIVEWEYCGEVYYQLSPKIIRKLKILKLSKDKVSNVIEKIINKSTQVSAEEFLENKLSQEVAKAIDKKILEDVMELDKKENIFPFQSRDKHKKY